MTHGLVYGSGLQTILFDGKFLFPGEKINGFYQRCPHGGQLSMLNDFLS